MPKNRHHHHRSLVGKLEAEEALGRAVGMAISSEPGSLVLVRSTMGAGKSMVARAAIDSTKDVGTRWMLVVPTHELANQHAQALDAPDVGVRRTVATAGGCLREPEVRRLMVLGVEPEKRICPTCPHLGDHGGQGSPCPAFQRATTPVDHSRVQVVQSTQCHVHISEAAWSPEAKPIIVLDEPPDAVVTVEVVRNAMSYVQLLQPSVGGNLAPLVRGVLEATARLKPGDKMTLREALGTSAAAVIKEAKSVRMLSLKAEAERELAGRTGDPKDVLSAKAFVEALLEAVHAHPKMNVLVMPNPDDWGSKVEGKAFLVAPAPWIRALRLFMYKGGKALILDGTADPGLLKFLGLKFEDVLIDVEDGPRVERTYVRWSNGSRRGHLSGRTVNWDRVQGVLRDLAGRCPPRTEVGIIADKVLAQALQAEINQIRNKQPARVKLPEEFVEAVIKASEVRVGWYGAHRGLDHWATCTVLATIGDPFPPVDVMHAEAMALGRVPRAHQHRRVHTEIVQATGRARPVHRDDRIVMVHYGMTKPWEQLAPQWERAVSLELERGRPRENVMDYEELLAVRDDKGSVRAVADELGVSVGKAHKMIQEAERQGRLAAISNAGCLNAIVEREGSVVRVSAENWTDGGSLAFERPVNDGATDAEVMLDVVHQLVSDAMAKDQAIAVTVPVTIKDITEGRASDPKLKDRGQAIASLGEFPRVYLNGV